MQLISMIGRTEKSHEKEHEYREVKRTEAINLI